jgi:aspartokinase
MISTSEIKISVVVSRDNAEDAVKALHDVFELD